MIYRLSPIIIIFVLAFCNGTAPANAQAPSSSQKQAIRSIKSQIDRAGKLYSAKRTDDSRDEINEAIKTLVELTTGEPSPELIELLTPEYQRLQKAHELLTAAGETLDELPALAMSAVDAVSFKTNVAPILLAKCGRCHVDRNQGNFSAASFDSLERSTTIAFGIPQDSRLIEVIESGEMPKGGLTVEPAELETLKAWIKQGAKFDGIDRTQNLKQLVGATAAPDRNDAMPEVAMATGNESVSFGLHIAPILVKNCGSCHMVNNPRGNFNQTDFRGLLAGGDSGSPINPGKSKTSPLFQRIAAGEMPPTGKLDDKLIALIGKWIDEGAKFDGGSPRLSMVSVAAVAQAKSQTHQQLIDARRTAAAKTWSLAMGRVEGRSHASNNFFVTGADDDDRLADVADLLERLTPKIAKTLDADSSQPFVKGNVSVFVFDKRYDFSEFGKMVEQREFPKQISGHWNYNITNAYATILLTRNEVAADAEVMLAQQLAAIHAASLAPDVPRWFADGLGYWATKKILAKNESVKSWDAAATSAAATMKAPDDFVSNRMPSDQAGLVSYLFVKSLKSNNGAFKKLISAMHDGESFDASFTGAYGMSAAEMLKLAYQKGW